MRVDVSTTLEYTNSPNHFKTRRTETFPTSQKHIHSSTAPRCLTQALTSEVFVFTGLIFLYGVYNTLFSTL